MTNGDLQNYAEILVPPRTRGLAVVTGCFLGLAGSLSFGPFFSLVPSVLIIGALLQRSSPRPGRWLMWLGAFFLTLYTAGSLGPFILRPSRLLDSSFQQVLAFGILSLLLVGWCDVALIIDSRESSNVPVLAVRGFPRPADGIVGVIAVCLTAWDVWSIVASFYPVRNYGNWQLGLVVDFSVTAFDVAIVAHAIRMYRNRQSHSRSVLPKDSASA
jgi:hypothetical protein